LVGSHRGHLIKKSNGVTPTESASGSLLGQMTEEGEYGVAKKDPMKTAVDAELTEPEDFDSETSHGSSRREFIKTAGIGGSFALITLAGVRSAAGLRSIRQDDDRARCFSVCWMSPMRGRLHPLT
jgi:hypothetical protein